MQIKNQKDYIRSLQVLEELSHNVREEWAYIYSKKLKVRIRNFEKDLQKQKELVK